MLHLDPIQYFSPSGDVRRKRQLGLVDDYFHVIFCSSLNNDYIPPIPYRGTASRTGSSYVELPSTLGAGFDKTDNPFTLNIFCRDSRDAISLNLGRGSPSRPDFWPRSDTI